MEAVVDGVAGGEGKVAEDIFVVHRRRKEPITISLARRKFWLQECSVQSLPGLDAS